MPEFGMSIWYESSDCPIAILSTFLKNQIDYFDNKNPNGVYYSTLQIGYIWRLCTINLLAPILRHCSSSLYCQLLCGVNYFNAANQDMYDIQDVMSRVNVWKRS